MIERPILRDVERFCGELRILNASAAKRAEITGHIVALIECDVQIYQGIWRQRH